MEKPQIIALIVAAGSGSRMGDERPKQYRLLAGKPVLRRSIAAFTQHPMVDAVCVVIHPGHQDLYAEATAGLTLLPAVEGGKTRQESVRNGIEHLFSQFPQAQVLVHDAARCFIDSDTISHVISALGEHEAVIPTLPVNDTIKRVENDTVTQTLDRNQLASAQTPQGFSLATLHRLHQGAANNAATDDAALAEAAGITVHCVAGHTANVKLTTPEDWSCAEMLESAMMETRTGQGFDVHRLIPANGQPMKLCGVEIAHDHILEGHSDGDVGLHALVDAILGALAAGDIGSHFPPSDPQWKGKDSSAFLAHAKHLMETAGGALAHADITLICEAPKIAPHRISMQQRIAALLNITPNQISIKATTSEGLGFTGRGEGIAAQAIATLRLPRR